MFKAKNIKTQKIEPILDTYVDDTCGTTFFLYGVVSGFGILQQILFHQIGRKKSLEDKLS